MNLPVGKTLSDSDGAYINDAVTKVVTIQRQMNREQVITKETVTGALFLTGIVFTVGAIAFVCTASINRPQTTQQTQMEQVGQ